MNLGQLKQFGEMQVNMMQEFVDLVDRVQDLEIEKRRLENENDNLRDEIHSLETSIENLLEELNGADSDPDHDCDYCDCRFEENDDTYDKNDLPEGIKVGDRVFIKGTLQGCRIAEGFIGFVTDKKNTDGWLGSDKGAVNVQYELHPDVVFRVNKEAIHKTHP